MSRIVTLFTTNPNVVAHQTLRVRVLASFLLFQKCPDDAVDETFHPNGIPCSLVRDAETEAILDPFILPSPRISLKGEKLSNYVYCNRSCLLTSV